jgi:hypothetical protein
MAGPGAAVLLAVLLLAPAASLAQQQDAGSSSSEQELLTEATVDAYALVQVPGCDIGKPNSLQLVPGARRVVRCTRVCAHTRRCAAACGDGSAARRTSPQARAPHQPTAGVLDGQCVVRMPHLAPNDPAAFTFEVAPPGPGGAEMSAAFVLSVQGGTASMCGQAGMRMRALRREGSGVAACCCVCADRAGRASGSMQAHAGACPHTLAVAVHMPTAGPCGCLARPSTARQT